MADWKITWNGRSWTEDDLTGTHVALIVTVQESDSWAMLNPLAGPLHLIGVLAAFIALADNRPVGDVAAELFRARAKDLADAIDVVTETEGIAEEV